MTAPKVIERDMKLLSKGNLIMEDWYLFLQAIDTIQHPDSNKPYAPFTGVWRSRKGYSNAEEGQPASPSDLTQTERYFSANRPGGTGEMYYFALQLQQFVEWTYQNRREDMIDYDDMIRLMTREHPQFYNEVPEGPNWPQSLGVGLLWDRPGWYVEIVQSRRPQDEIDFSDVPPWPTIILGYASNAAVPNCVPEWRRKRPADDFRSVHVMTIEYDADQNMKYRLIWEQSGTDTPPERHADEYEDSWVIPTKNNSSSPAIIPIRRPIAYIFKPKTEGLLNYPYATPMSE